MSGRTDGPPRLGTTMIRRDMFRGDVRTAYPTRVIDSSPQALVLAHWPGVRVRVPTTWIGWLQGAGDAVRERAIPNLARGTWELGLWTWRTTMWLHMLLPDRWFSVNAVFDDDSGRLLHWYVNFQRPYEIRGTHLDTFDLFLDLVVGADLSMRWKDEVEYERACRLGVVSEAEAREVGRAREEAVALVKAGDWPFSGPWAGWRRDPDWRPPSLPDTASAGDAERPSR